MTQKTDYSNRQSLYKQRIAFLFFLVVFAYAIFNSRNIIIGPKIELFYPKGNIEIKEKSINISGTVKNATFFSLNGRQIKVSVDGGFSEQVLLYPGYNIIQMYAVDRFKSHKEKTIEVYYSQEVATTSINTN